MTEQTRLIVLGMLLKQPMHGYEIRRQLDLSRVSQWTEVAPGSVYHALRKMESEQLLSMDGTQSTGQRTRAVYSVTNAGRLEFQRLLQQAWNTPPQAFPSVTYLALLFRHSLSPAEIKEHVQYLQVHLRKTLREWEQGEQLKGILDPEITLTFQNGREHLEVDLRLLDRIAQMIDADLLAQETADREPSAVR